MPDKACALLDHNSFERTFTYKDTYAEGTFTDTHYTCLNELRMDAGVYFKSIDYVVKGRYNIADYFKIAVIATSRLSIEFIQGQHLFEELLQKLDYHPNTELDFSKTAIYAGDEFSIQIVIDTDMHHQYKLIRNDAPEDLKAIYLSE